MLIESFIYKICEQFQPSQIKTKAFNYKRGSKYCQKLECYEVLWVNSFELYCTFVPKPAGSLGPQLVSNLRKVVRTHCDLEEDATKADPGPICIFAIFANDDFIQHWTVARLGIYGH